MTVDVGAVCEEDRTIFSESHCYMGRKLPWAVIPEHDYSVFGVYIDSEFISELHGNTLKSGNR